MKALILIILIGAVSCKSVEPGTDQYYYNLTKKQHPEWTPEQIEDYLFKPREQ